MQRYHDSEAHSPSAITGPRLAWSFAAVVLSWRAGSHGQLTLSPSHLTHSLSLSLSLSLSPTPLTACVEASRHAHVATLTRRTSFRRFSFILILSPHSLTCFPLAPRLCACHRRRPRKRQ